MITLETAKLLKEVGWNKLTSLAYDTGEIVKRHYEYTGTPDVEYYYLPTLEELLTEMPQIDIHRVKSGKAKKWYYNVNTKIGDWFSIRNPDPAEAVAILWLQLKQEGLV